MDSSCHTSSPELNMGERCLVSKANFETLEVPEIFPFSDPSKSEVGLRPILRRDLQQWLDWDFVDIQPCVLGRQNPAETDDHSPLF